MGLFKSCTNESYYSKAKTSKNCTPQHSQNTCMILYNGTVMVFHTVFIESTASVYYIHMKSTLYIIALGGRIWYII